MVKTLKEVLQEYGELVETCDQVVLFLQMRIPHDNIPDGLYVYDVREDSYGQGLACDIEDFVGVNWLGTILCKDPIDLPDGNEPSKFRSLINGEFTAPPDCDSDEGFNDEDYMNRYGDWLDHIDQDWNYLGAEMSVAEYAKASREELADELEF